VNPSRPDTHVALVTTSWPSFDGDPSGHFVLAHARALERCGNRVTVIAPDPGGAFGWPGVAARLRQRPFRAIAAIRWVRIARRRVESLHPDRIVAHWAIPCAWPIASGGSAPVDVVSHGTDVRWLTRSPDPARTWIVRAIARRASSWTFVSQSLLDELAARLHPVTRALLARVARVEPAPLEMPDVRAHVAELARQLGDRRVAVIVGRLVESKRVERAIEHVARSIDIDTLVVVGDGPERRRLEERARELGVDARFVGLVGRERALAWIGAAGVLLHASRAEGLSTVVREADALGTRVVRLE
jgi:glycosyltransferase involved in cell wall biosynthesis